MTCYQDLPLCYQAPRALPADRATLADAARVPFEFLHRTDGQLPLIDQAEQRVLWDVEAGLERQLPVFADNYAQRVAAARRPGSRHPQ